MDLFPLVSVSLSLSVVSRKREREKSFLLHFLASLLEKLLLFSVVVSFFVRLRWWAQKQHTTKTNNTKK